MDKSLMKKVAAEFLGTLMLVLVGCGAAVLSGWNPLVTALAFGLAVLTAVCMFGPISGGHINPAVTVAMCIDRRISVGEAIAYIVSQVLGAFAGIGLLILFLNGSTTHLGASLIPTDYRNATAYGNAAMNVGNGMGIFIALVSEIVLTSLFVVAFMNSTRKKGSEHNLYAGITTGFAFTMLYLLSVNLTGGGLNPARSLACIIQGTADGNFAAASQIWLFLLMPLVGAVFGAITHRFMFGAGEESDTAGQTRRNDDYDTARPQTAQRTANIRTEAAPSAGKNPVQARALNNKPMSAPVPDSRR
jgi:aquaporin Z